MMRLVSMMLFFTFALAAFHFSAAQEGGFEGKKKGKKEKGGQDETAKMAKMIEKSYKKLESERDKVIKEFSKIRPGTPLGDDFADWFERVATSPTAWNRNGIERKQIAEIFQRMSDRLEITGDTISRADFLGYAKNYWRADRSPPWKDAKNWDLDKEAEKMFRRLDRDGDGYLSEAEMSDALRANLRHWDKNGDGRIELRPLPPQCASQATDR